MTVLKQSIVVARPIEEVFTYVADFANCPQWDATAFSSEKISPGPLGIGTCFDVACKLPVGSVKLQYEVTHWQENEKITLMGTCKWFSVEDTITFAAEASGTRLNYQATFNYKFGLERIVPLIEPGLKRMGYEAVCVGLKQALEDNNPPPQLSKHNALAEKVFPWALGQFTRYGYQRGLKHWSPVSAYMRNKHIVLTGATAGLGLSTAQALAAMGAQLTLVIRDESKGRDLVDRLINDTGNKHISFEVADLSLMNDITELIQRLRERAAPIDVLINNAGALFNPRQVTEEGLEKSFALLLLGPYLLTEGLLPLLKKASTPRVINVVSGGLYSQKLVVDELMSDRGQYSGSEAYARCKRALLVKTQQWAEDWQQYGIVVNAMHPGWADTPGVQSALPEFRKIARLVLRSSAEGADTIVWLAAATEAKKVSGLFFLDREPRTAHLRRITQESIEEREKLRNYLVEQSKFFLSELN